MNDNLSNDKIIKTTTTTTTLTMKNKVTLKSLQEKLNRVLANKNPSMKKSSLSMIIGTLYAFS